VASGDRRRRRGGSDQGSELARYLAIRSRGAARTATLRQSRADHRSPASRQRTSEVSAGGWMILGCGGSDAVDHGLMRGDDFTEMAGHLREAARVGGNGEVAWPLPLAKAAVESLTRAGRIILGLGIRDYDNQGRSLKSPGVPSSRTAAVTRRKQSILLAPPPSSRPWPSQA
jgi:hypothetical protein